MDSEINELVEGSDLYTPKVSLQQVVLPKGQLGTIVRQCRAYDDFRKYRQIMGLEDIMSYGNSLVILLCGIIFSFYLSIYLSFSFIVHLNINF